MTHATFDRFDRRSDPDLQVSDADVRRDLNNLRKNVETIIEAFREDWLTGQEPVASEHPTT